MALDKLVDSGALDASLDYTATVIAAMLLHLAGMDGQTVPPMPYDLAGGTGFGSAVLAFTNTHPVNTGSVSPAEIGNICSAAKAGSFILAADRTSAYTVTHNLGAAPDLVIFWSGSGAVADPGQITKDIMSFGARWSRSLQSNPTGNVAYKMRAGSTAQAQVSGGVTAATATTFTIGAGNNWALGGGATYYWVAAALKGGN